MSHNSTFKKKYSFQTRIEESRRLLTMYPNKRPIICEKATSQSGLPDTNKQKYLVPYDLTLSQFITVIRQKMKLKQQDAIFVFINDQIMTGSALIGNIYNFHRDTDGFLYIQYTKENTFG